MKKFVCVLLAFLLLMAGCSAPAPAPAPPDSTATDVSEVSQTPSDSEAPSAEPVEFTILFLGTTTLPPLEDDPIMQQLNADLNMKLDFQVVTAEYDTVLNTRISGGTPPDLFYIDQTQLYNLGRQGYLLEWSDALLDKMPNIRSTYWEDLYNVGKVDGVMYALAKRPFKYHWQQHVRQDWLDTLGLSAPTNIEELREVARAFTQDDPDGNGVMDTYGLTGLGLDTFNIVFTSFGVGMPYGGGVTGGDGAGDFIVRNGEVVYSTVDPAMKDALAFIKTLIDDGSVDPEIMSNKGEAANEKLYSGMAGMGYAQYSKLNTDRQKVILEINPNAKWTGLGDFEGQGGTYHGTQPAAMNSDMLAMPKSLEESPEKLDKILEYLNYITGNSPGQNLVTFGVEGIHYELDTAGKMTALPAMDDLSYSFLHQLTGRDDANYYEVKYPTQIPQMELADTLTRLKTYNSFIPLPTDTRMSPSDKDTFQLEEITAFIYGRKPLNEFDAFVTELYETYELQKYIDVAESVLGASGYLN